MIEAAIFKALDAGLLTNDLAVYSGGKAIFTTDLPDDCGFPAILIAAAGGQAWGTRGNKGGEHAIEVKCFDDKERSSKACRDLATKVYELLDRHALPDLPAGCDNNGCQAEPPAASNDEFGFPGFVIRLTVRILKTS